MEDADYAPLVTALLIVVVALLAGPVFGIPSDASRPGGCEAAGPIGSGNASVTVTELPDSAVMERMAFSSEVYELRVGDAHLNVSDVRGRPTVAYKLRLERNSSSLAIGRTAILSRCDTVNSIQIQDSAIEPDSDPPASYNATLTVTYRGSQAGEDVETVLEEKTITVEVRE